MKEFHEFRIYDKYAHLLLRPDEGKRMGIYRAIKILRDDPKFDQIKRLTERIRLEHNDYFFLYSNITRQYAKEELDNASLLQLKIATTFEPAGEECGTEYDETLACDICGTNRKQITPLKLRKGSIPKQDIARTIAGEVVVSEKLKENFQRYNLKGVTFDSILAGKSILNIYQPKVVSPELELSVKTIAGTNVFDLSHSSGTEIYKCPKGHTIGLNLLSEAFVVNSPAISGYDFFVTKQKIGVNRGLLRPQPLYICSQAFRQMVLKEKLSGFDFEVAHVEE